MALGYLKGHHATASPSLWEGAVGRVVPAPSSLKDRAGHAAVRVF